MTELAWSPLSIDEAYRLFAAMPVRWWIAGGLAIDLFLGRRTRAHGDIDIQILRDDEREVARQLRGWELMTARAGTLAPWHEAARASSIWCRPRSDAPWALELLVADVRDGAWIYRRNAAVTRPLAELGAVTPDGVPFLRPEIQLLFKSKRVRARDEADLCAALPALGPAARAWLRTALATTDPAHAWLARF